MSDRHQGNLLYPTQYASISIQVQSQLLTAIEKGLLECDQMASISITNHITENHWSNIGHHSWIPTQSSIQQNVLWALLVDLLLWVRRECNQCAGRPHFWRPGDGHFLLQVHSDRQIPPYPRMWIWSILLSFYYTLKESSTHRHIKYRSSDASSTCHCETPCKWTGLLSSIPNPPILTLCACTWRWGCWDWKLSPVLWFPTTSSNI